MDHQLACMTFASFGLLVKENNAAFKLKDFQNIFWITQKA
jgi:hypothetical protein